MQPNIFTVRFFLFTKSLFPAVLVAVMDIRITSCTDTAPFFRHSVHQPCTLQWWQFEVTFSSSIPSPSISGLETDLCFRKYLSHSCSLQLGPYWWEGITTDSGLWLDPVSLRMRLLRRVPSRPGSSHDLTHFFMTINQEWSDSWHSALLCLKPNYWGTGSV